MDRRTFLLGLIGGLAAAAGLAGTGANPAHALPLDSTPAPDDATDASAIKPEDLEGVRIEEAQYWRRRRYYRRYWGPRRRYWRRRYAATILSPVLAAPAPLLASAVLVGAPGWCRHGGPTARRAVPTARSHRRSCRCSFRGHRRVLSLPHRSLSGRRPRGLTDAASAVCTAGVSGLRSRPRTSLRLGRRSLSLNLICSYATNWNAKMLSPRAIEFVKQWTEENVAAGPHVGNHR